MAIKQNEATGNRPWGDRILDAPYVFADLAAFTRQVKEEAAWEKSDRNGITVFKSAGITIVLTALKESAVIKDNLIDGFLVVQVLQGTIRMETPEGDGDMEENQLMTFHPGISHSIEAKTDTLLLLTTYLLKEE